MQFYFYLIKPVHILYFILGMDYSQDGGSILLQNVDMYTATYIASYPEDWNLHKTTHWDSMCKINLHEA